MYKVKNLYLAFFLVIITSCFLFGGFLQFFVGIPNTVFTYGIVLLLYFFYFIYVAIKKKVFVDKTIMIMLLLIIVIFLSSITNSTSFSKTSIYLLFVLLPLGVHIFFKVNKKEAYISNSLIGKLFLFIACLQLPVIFIQKIGFDFFIKFNLSSQEVESFDFMFGTFFLKADHALGFFLLFNIINIVRFNKKKQITKHPKVVFLYLALTVFMTESNISKVILLLLICYSAYISFPKKIRIFGLILALILVPLLFQITTRNIEAFEREVYFAKEEYNTEKSFSNFERGIAKRPQVVLVYLNKIPLKIIGDGPYSYFNILKGEFTKTKHFSQLIWTYADLGIIGLTVVVALLYNLTMGLGLKGTEKYIILFVVLIYSFMTTILSDIAIIITLISLLKKEEINEYSYSPIS